MNRIPKTIRTSEFSQGAVMGDDRRHWLLMSMKTLVTRYRGQKAGEPNTSGNIRGR